MNSLIRTLVARLHVFKGHQIPLLENVRLAEAPSFVASSHRSFYFDKSMREEQLVALTEFLPLRDFEKFGDLHNSQHVSK